MKYDFVLYDFDGVIIKNSQTIQFEVLIEHLKMIDISITIPDLFLTYSGVKGELVLADIENKFQRKIQIAELLTSVRREYKLRILEYATCDNDLQMLLSLSQRNFICSSNSFDFIYTILSKQQLIPFFKKDDIFSAEQVKTLKPSPEIYLKVIEQNKLTREFCCAIDDSVVGVQAAKSANVFTFGYTGGFPEEINESQSNLLSSSGADCIIHSFNELLASHEYS
jgi:putative hydrolase of the HAD superfamily